MKCINWIKRINRGEGVKGGFRGSSKAEKFEFDFLDILDGGTDDGRSDLYYPLVADKNISE